MSDYFAEIFDNKTKFETKEDLDKLNEKLKAGNWVENQYNEAKIITKLNEEYKNKIISEICAFLNSSEGQGTLYLGIEAKNEIFTEIKPIDQKIIKDESHLRDIIKGNLGIYPKEFIFPVIDIKTITFIGGCAYILIVKNLDNTVVYYSKITDYIYQRHGKSTIKLSLKEQLSLIESKKIAKVFVRINREKDIFFYNEGVIPAKKVTTLITILCDRSLKINITGQNVIKQDNSVSDNLIFQINSGNLIGSILIYPVIPTVVAKLSVSGQGFFKMQMKTYEENGYSEQNVSFSYIADELSLIESKEDYYTYI